MGYNKETRKAYLKKNAEKIAEQKKVWYESNKSGQSEYQKVWRSNNKEHMRDYQRKKILNDPLFRLKKSIKTSIWGSFYLIDGHKPSRTEQILGCTYNELMIHLESKFEDWMTWDNRGNWNGIPTEPNVAWDVDHIIPLATAKNEFDIVRLNHYTNLQPLCSYVNRYVKKGNVGND
jgi:hypothetical protein